MGRLPRLLWVLGVACLAGCDQPAGGGAGTAGGPVPFTTKSGIAMVYLPGGEFTMGSDRGGADEAPAHRVRLSAFAIDKTEVTQAMFAQAQLPNPSRWQDPKKPVERVRWRDARQYCNERSLLDGLKPCYDDKLSDGVCDFAAGGYRLPTEAEWEYAARAGGSGTAESSSPDALRSRAWFADNADGQTHAVGLKPPNRWGLGDMEGNVAEWCEDVFSPTYYKDSPAVDPRGPASPGQDVQRVLRGGSWKASAAACRLTFRQGERTGNTDACFYTDYVGFRCVRRIAPEELAGLRGVTK